MSWIYVGREQRHGLTLSGGSAAGRATRGSHPGPCSLQRRLQGLGFKSNPEWCLGQQKAPEPAPGRLGRGNRPHVRSRSLARGAIDFGRNCPDIVSE